MGFPNNIHNKANIPPDILQLLPNAFPYLFARAFLALGQFQIVFAGSSAPHPGLFQLVGFTVSINDVLQLFLCFIQKLEILRDSHSGYFAIIICVCYFFLIVGLWSEMPLDSWPVLAYGFILSRALYGLSIECFPHSQESKCSLYVGKGKSRGIVIAFMIAYIVISVVGMLMCDIQVAIPCLVGALLAFLYYCYVAFHHFGGITEDIACFFVQVCEIMMPLVVLLTSIATRLDIAGEL
jgi:hypothetical protein